MISDDKCVLSLQVQSLGYRRGLEWLFRGVSFDIRAGQLFWLRGQNGRGKTSLLRLLVGLTQPDEGNIEQTTSIYIGHANALKEDLTAMEALQFLLQLQGHVVTNVAIAEGMRIFSIYSRRNQIVRTLSQGQRRRVALARLALEKNASLWILDEPFEALDVEGIEVLHKLINEHTKRGGSVLLTSHIPVESSHTVVNVLDLDAMASA